MHLVHDRFQTIVAWQFLACFVSRIVGAQLVFHFVLMCGLLPSQVLWLEPSTESIAGSQSHLDTSSARLSKRRKGTTTS